MKALVIPHEDGLQKCMLAAILRLPSAKSHLQRKRKPFVTFDVGKTLVYTPKVYPEFAK